MEGLAERMKTMQITKALTAAATEIRQSKRSYEQKLACNIKQLTARVFMHMSGVNKT